MLVTENQLDEWVRGNAQSAQSVIVELVWRLVAASSPRPSERRFPLGDSIGQPGPDGLLDTDFGFDPFVPVGRSYWEIGTGLDVGRKATSDYKDLTESIPAAVRRESIFTFVTPLSGRRGWKANAQAKWLENRRQRNDWRDVRVVDGSRLIDWMHHFLSVGLWLAEAMGLPVQQVETPEQRWASLRIIGEPPPLTPQVFLANRDSASEKLKELFSGTTFQLKLDTHFPNQVADFVAACVATMDEEVRPSIAGRCLIISGAGAWNAITALRDRHILVADFDLDDADLGGVRLLERARSAGHAVIFPGIPGGISSPNRVPLPSPKSYQVREALEKAGYAEERARNLAQKSNGNLNSLLRCLQNLSVTPEWVHGTDAATIAVGELLGAWNENSQADKTIVERLSGESYGQWIGKMRDIVFRSGTPLVQRNGTWKVGARYEGWYALGPRIFDEHLDRLREVAVWVLQERDPQFELPPDKRYAASIFGKVLAHSRSLRNGLAESLALLGSHPKALTSCSFGKAETTAVLVVREVLSDADWALWASLNDLLPMLAEAAPEEFLDAVENALDSAACPFDTVFRQEGDGFWGSNYMTGLLWALETLAWDAEYLTRVVVILGELAARDPGGNWANRPANSLSTILLPWLPQTCASVSKRQAAVAALLKEFPNVAWRLLQALLPSTHQVSAGARKPAWMEAIAGDWASGVSYQEYYEQVSAYAELAVSTAKQDIAKLADLVERLDDLPPTARHHLLAYLRSDSVVLMPQADRLRLWTQLVDLVARHRKFADADWAMEPEVVNEIAAVADVLAPEAPIYRHQRLFSEHGFHLYDEKGSFEEQRQKLEALRQKAVEEVFAAGGVEEVLEFAKAVDLPRNVGVTFGTIDVNDGEENILPALLQSETTSLAHFARGFVWEMFRRRGWQWVDAINTSQWVPSQKGQFLAYLPFSPDTWQRAAHHLGEDESPYWSRAAADYYEAEKGVEWAVDRLVQHGRPNEAIKCLRAILLNKRSLDAHLAIRTLQAVFLSSENARTMDVGTIVDIITALQCDPNTDPDELSKVEWAFLPLLDRHRGGSPRQLQQRLVDDPAFFCEVIQTAFRSEKDKRSTEDLTEQRKSIAANAYRLLREWRTPPGSQKDGAFSGDKLADWLGKAKASCAKAGHLGIALEMIGHVLAYTPPDPDGLWIHHSAASALNDKDAKNMRNGFWTELLNSRGAYWGTGGRAERELAANYRKKAEELEAHGYHRLASSVKRLASSYEHEAEREALDDVVG